MKTVLLTSITSLFVISFFLVLPQAFAVDLPLGSNFLSATNAKDYSDLSYSDPTNPSAVIHVWESHSPRLPDSAGNYNSPYLVYDNGPSYTIASGEGTYVYDKNTCSIKFYSPTKTPNSLNDIINSISFTVQQTDNPNATSYDLSSINSASCTTDKTDDGNTITIKGTKTNADGTFVTEYTMLADSPMEYKASYYPNTNSSHYYVITESQDGIGSNIKINVSNGTQINSAVNNEDLITGLVNDTGGLNYGNNGFYDLQNAKQYLHKSSFVINPDGVKHIYNDFMSDTPITQGDVFTIDPIFGYNNPSWRQNIQTNTHATASCATAGSTTFTGTNTTLPVIKEDDSTAAGGACTVPIIKWDTTSIPDGSTVNSTTLKYDITGAGVNSRNCDYVQVLNNWVVSTNQTKYDNVASSPVTYVSNSTACTTVGAGKTLVLGSSANTDVQNNLPVNYFNLGMKENPFGRQAGVNHSVQFQNVQLQVVYTWTPAASTLLKVNTLSTSSINSTWTKPFTALWYLVFRESPHGGGFSQVANTTNQFFVDSGLDAGTNYNYKIFAGNTNGYNATAPSNQKQNYTSQVAPTSLTATPVISTTERIGWTNPSGNFSGFFVEKAPDNSTWATVVSNTNNSTNRYDLTGLTPGTVEYSRISTNYAYSSVTSPSHSKQFYTLNNPPTGVTGTPQAGNQILVTWVSPGNTVNGYKIEVSVNGGAFSVLVSNTTTTATSYTQTGASISSTYSYRIYTSDPAGFSVASTPSTPVVAGDVPAQVLPPGISFNNTSPVIISWAAPSANGHAISGYRIDVSINSAPFIIAVSNTGSTSTTYSYPIVSKTIYVWRVEAINDLGTGPLGIPSQAINSGDAPTIGSSITTPSSFRNLNTTSINLHLSSVPRNSTSYDVFTLNQDNWFWAKFDNTTLDSGSLSLGNGTVTGVSTYVTGKFNQAFSFNNNTSISWGNNENFENNSPFSATFCFKTSETGHRQIILSKQNTANSIGWDIRVSTSNTLTFDLINTATTNELSVRSSVSVTDGILHCDAITYDGSKTPGGVKIYEDAVIDPSPQTVFNTLSSTIINSQNFVIGANADGTSPFNGLIDNPKIYPYVISPSQVTTDFSTASPLVSGKQFMSWYNGLSGSSTLTKKVGNGQSTLTLSCSPSTSTQTLESNTINVYYLCPGVPSSFYGADITNGINNLKWHATTPAGPGFSHLYPFVTKTKLMSFVIDDSVSTTITTSAGNTTLGGTPGSETFSNQKVHISGQGMFKYHFNGTALVSNAGTDCDLQYVVNNSTNALSSVACDNAVPPLTIRYLNGMNILGSALFYTNSTQYFLNSIDASPYKKLLSLPCEVLVTDSTCETFIGTDFSGTDTFYMVTPTHVYFTDAATALYQLTHQNYGFQSYDVITTITPSTYPLQNPLLQAGKLYNSLNVNTTINKAGLFTLPSGYTTKTTSIETVVRTIDPRWTNDGTDIPIIYSTVNPLFPIVLTVSNAPEFSAIKVTSPSQVINAQESVWAVAQLDAAKTVEFDIPPNTCVNIYIADISTAPSVWNSQGNLCATGTNQKTIVYTNTVPLTFFTNTFGATHQYTASSNILTTSVRSVTIPFTYQVVVKNATGTTAINQTFTSINGLDQHSFNVTGVVKPASLYIYNGNNLAYSAYLGSPLSLASTAAFFHTYFSYQGFDLLSFIPIIFASMFTRNTVGVGVALTVVCIATLSWLSIVVIPDQTIYIAIFIAAIGLVGYRASGYY